VEVACLEGWKPKLVADAERLSLVSSDRVAVLDDQRLCRLTYVSRSATSRSIPSGGQARGGGRVDPRARTSWSGRRTDGPGFAACPASSRCAASRSWSPATSPTCSAPRGRHSTSGISTTRRRPGRSSPRSQTEWGAFLMDRSPAVATSSSVEGVRVVERDGPRWRGTPLDGGRLASSRTSPRSRRLAVLTVISSGFPGSLRVRSWEGDRMVGDRRLGRSSPFPTGMQPSTRGLVGQRNDVAHLPQLPCGGRGVPASTSPRVHPAAETVRRPLIVSLVITVDSVS
jgi:hypothetical protein